MANPEHVKVLKKDAETATQKQFDPDETLSWDHLGGPDKEYLLKHLEQTRREIENSQCRM